jgi:small-conductance mechanosensitive channel
MSAGSPLVAFAIDALILAAAGVVFATTVNRLVRRKLRLTLALAALSALVSLVAQSGQIPAAVAGDVRALATLLQVLAAVNLVVVAVVNPLRADRVSEHFPNIVQDAIVVVLFAIVAVLVLGERVFVTSAVGAVVLGFALQDTLGNAFAGLAIQIEKPFRVGQWIRVGEHEGKVAEITWRATKLRTKADAFVVVPNNLVSREAIVNYSEPVIPVRLSVEVGATYLKPPNEVKAAIKEAIDNAPLVLRDPAPDVLLVDFASSAITYRARFWVEDYARDEVARDQVRSAIYYSFARHDIEIPWPIQVEYERAAPEGRRAETAERYVELLGRVQVFAPLDPRERRDLVDLSQVRLYAAGETVVRQDAPGSSMFVVCSGDLRVILEPGRTEVARHGPGGFFGEMSLLTGKPRTASVVALSDSELLEITADAFRRFVLAQPAVLESVLDAVRTRQAELDHARANATTAVKDETPTSFLERVRQFLRLG